MADRTPEETQAYARRGMDEFYDSFTESERRAVESGIRSVLNSNAPASKKIERVYAAADQAFHHAAGKVACAKGCSHCCYIPVVITKADAKYIGERIGIKPAEVANVPPRSEKAFSNQTPCSFLENNECSIYENRPLTCRTHFSFDQDNYWCRYENWDKPGAAVPKPVLPMLAAAVALVAREKQAIPTEADIRDFFPTGKR
jgi:Fe-S-cluster containining protein